MAPDLLIFVSLSTCYSLLTYDHSPMSEVRFLPKGYHEKSRINLKKKKICVPKGDITIFKLVNPSPRIPKFS